MMIDEILKGVEFKCKNPIEKLLEFTQTLSIEEAQFVLQNINTFEAELETHILMRER